MRQINPQQDLFIDAPVWDKGLTGRQRRFVEYYCTDKTCFLNATASYIEAYRRPDKEPDTEAARPNAARMMRNPAVKDAIARLLRAHQDEEDQLSEYQILRLLKTLALYNPADILDKDGKLKLSKDSNDLNDLGALSFCITGIEKDGRGNKKIKLFDRVKALELLGNYLRIIRPTEGQSVLNANVYLADKEQEQIRLEEDTPQIPDADDAEFEVMGAGE